MTTIIGRYSAHITQGFFVERGQAYDTETDNYAAEAFRLHPEAFDVPNSDQPLEPIRSGLDNLEPVKRGPGRPRKEVVGE